MTSSNTDRTLRVVASLALAGLLLFWVVGRAHAIAQRVGDFELAVDAPWRMEPRPGFPTYGAIPIHVSIHDADLPNSDSSELLQKLIAVKQTGVDVNSVAWEIVKDGAVATHGAGILTILDTLDGGLIDSLPPLPGTTKLSRFIALKVWEENNGTYYLKRTYWIGDLHEVERTVGYWKWSALSASPESPAAPPVRPTYELCRQWNGEDCASLLHLKGTSEWHATAFYEPVFGTPGGRDVRLRVDLQLLVTVDGVLQSKTFSQYLSVHLGEESLPKFDDRWVYGDLHYHSQGTDNDGESANSYRGVLHAMSAMGLDFAFATDHASNSQQRPSRIRSG